MLHHYITKYEEGGRRYAEAWLQLDAFGRCWCFSRRRVEIDECNPCVYVDAMAIAENLGRETDACAG